MQGNIVSKENYFFFQIYDYFSTIINTQTHVGSLVVSESK